VARLTRWSKSTDQLVRHVALRCRPGFQSELAQWLEKAPRFSAFIARNRDKVRKKLTASDDEDSRLDVRSELLVAYLLLADRRFELAFEAYGARRLGPDLTVTYRANQRFNLEVTRLRAAVEPDTLVNRLANVIAAKLRQLVGDVPNALVITARGGFALSEDSLVAAARLLKMHSDSKDDAFFARRGHLTARDFYSRYLNLGGVVVLLDEASAAPEAAFWPNPEARHPLSPQATAALAACLSRSDNHA
jgi:hypothetical protein